MNREESLDFAREYVADLLTFFGENVDIKVYAEDDIIHVDVPSTNSNSILIGRGAETLRSIQYLVSNVLRNKEAVLSRVSLDIADYKKQREERIAEKAREWIAEVQRTGSSHVAHINAADRRVVHQVAKEFSDVRTYSEGEGRDRRLIIAQISS